MKVATYVHELLNQHKFNEAFDIAKKAYDESDQTLEKRQVIKPAFIVGEVDFGLYVLEEVIERNRIAGRISDTDLALAGAFSALTSNIDKSKKYFEIAISAEPNYTSNITVPIALTYIFSERFEWKEIGSKARKLLSRQSKKGIKIAKFLKKEISQEEFLMPEKTNEILLNRERCRKYYYVSGNSVIEGNIVKASEFRKKCINIEGRFLEIEYFIALQESRNSASN